MHQLVMTAVKVGHQHNTWQIGGLKQVPYDQLNGGKSPGNVHMHAVPGPTHACQLKVMTMPTVLTSTIV